MLIHNGNNSTAFSFGNFRPVGDNINSVGVLFGENYPVLNLIGADLNTAVRLACENYRELQQGIESSNYVGLTLSIFTNAVSISGQFGTAFSQQISEDEKPIQQYRISFKIKTDLSRIGGTIIRGSGWSLNWVRGSGISAEESLYGYLSIEASDAGYPADAKYAFEMSYSGLEEGLDSVSNTIDEGISRLDSLLDESFTTLKALVDETVSKTNARFVAR